MIWWFVSDYSSASLEGSFGTIDQKYYYGILENGMLPSEAEVIGKTRTVMDYGELVHPSGYDKKLLQEHSIDVMDWTTQPPEPKVIEKVWRMMVLVVFGDGHQFQNVENMAEAIMIEWENAVEEKLKLVYKYIPLHLLRVVSK